MKLEEAKIGREVQIHPGGSVFKIKYVFGRNASLVKMVEGNEEDYGNCPISLLEVVEK